MSLEQAYCLLLGINHLSAEAYFVYSNLTRAGYVVELHDPSRSFDRLTDFKDAKEDTTQKCVWTCLEQLLTRSDKPLQSSDMQLRETAASMQTIADQIRNPSQQLRTEPLESNPISTWNARPSRKRPRSKSPPREHRAEPFMDILFEEPNEHLRLFRDTFAQLQVIQLSPLDLADSSDDLNQAEITFDLFAGNAEYRKSSPGPPSFRVVVCSKSQGVPTRQSIFRLYEKQAFRTPIMVALVNEMMGMQAYVYVMSS